MKILTLFDNEAKESFKAGWGLSLLVKMRSLDFLFDTGADFETLNYNANLFKIDKEKISYCFISHKHYDHTGGIEWLSSGTKIFYPGEYRGEINNVFSIVLDTPIGIKEQSLLLKENDKNVLLVGCSHPGIVRIVQEANLEFGPIHFLVGGFHLFRESEDKIRKIAELLDSLVEYIAPCHCSGQLAKEIFREVFKERFINNFAGNIIEI